MNFKANINTFDVFDTLVARRCVLPTNIFKIMEERLGIANFAVTRIQAEQTLLGNPYNFDDIYCNVAEILNINEDETKKLKNQEITLEIENIIPIKENISKVKDGDILISDMYHTEEVVRSLLDAAGFKKQCALIVSNYGKHRGTIWPKVLKNFAISSHLGDNPHADGRSPAQFDIDYELTNRWAVHPIEKILYDVQFENFGSLLRAIRLGTWHEDVIRRKVQETQLLLSFPILVFASAILRRSAHHLGKRRLVFSARDCFNWKKLFETLYPNEFECVYYYTSRYSKCLHDADYIEYSNTIINKDSLIVDLCGSGWSLENFTQYLSVDSIDVFLIHKMPQNQEYMKGYTEQKCRYHFIVENEFESYKNHILEIANFADHPMLKTISKIDDVFCPVFFKEGRSETELSYVSMQTDMFDHCLSELVKHGVDKQIEEHNVKILGDLIKIFYRLLSQDVFSHTVYASNFFKENSEVESKINLLVNSGSR